MVVEKPPETTQVETRHNRVVYGWTMFFIAVVSVIAGGLVFALALGGVCYLAGNEFIGMVQAKGIRPSVRIVRGMIIAFFAISALPAVPGLNLSLPWNFALTLFPLLLTVGICISFFRLLFRNEEPHTTIADIATTILGFIYVGFLPCHLVLLRVLSPPGVEPVLNPTQQPGLAFVWAGIFSILATDTFAYYAGRHWGKTLLYPQISPKKTVEGAVGGFVAAILWATLVVYLSDNFLFPNHPFAGKLWQAPLMGAVVSVAAQLGDLCESLLKRDAGMKDSGTLFTIPGHGGILDRGDSWIFAGAVSYYWVCIVVLGIL
jgi:phosphatidate cytidylyltransferase